MRCRDRPSHGFCRSLRAGGGGALAEGQQAIVDLFSPRRRRWCGCWGGLRSGAGVLSAQAEVVRTRQFDLGGVRRSLRAGGGGAPLFRPGPDVRRFSPRRRRWCVHPHLTAQVDSVLSAQAEVVRCSPPCSRLSRCSLRAGGGGAQSWRPEGRAGAFSPRRRRWCGPRRHRAAGRPVLSAQAEVVRRRSDHQAVRTRSLRAGGGGASISWPP